VQAFRNADPQAASAAMIAHMRPAPDASAMTDFIVNLPKELLVS
jgi:hypothetical protein